MYTFQSEPLLPWADTDNDYRFNKVAKKVLLVFFVFSILFPLLPTPEKQEDEFKELPPHLVRLITKQQKIKPVLPKPKPKKKIEKKKPKKKIEKKKPKKKPKKKKPPKPKPSARQQAQSVFAEQFDELADLRPAFDVKSLKGSKLKKSSKRKTKSDTSGMLMAKAGGGSGGINTQSLSTATGSSGKFTKHKTANVTSAIPTTGATSTPRNSGWSTEEIQLTFQRYKGALNSIYNRALRTDPGLKGTIELRITINPAGRVVKVIIVSSDINNKQLEKRIRIRVKSFKFGSKATTETFTFNYPLTFFER